jgi:Outer membrane efflux protein
MALYATNGVGGKPDQQHRAAHVRVVPQPDALVWRSNDSYGQRQVQEQVTLDLNNAVHPLEQARLGITAGKDALESAKKTMAAVQPKYDLGSSTIFLVLEAQTELAAAEQSPDPGRSRISDRNCGHRSCGRKAAAAVPRFRWRI